MYSFLQLYLQIDASLTGTSNEGLSEWISRLLSRDFVLTFKTEVSSTDREVITKYAKAQLPLFWEHLSQGGTYSGNLETARMVMLLSELTNDLQNEARLFEQLVDSAEGEERKRSRSAGQQEAAVAQRWSSGSMGLALRWHQRLLQGPAKEAVTSKFLYLCFSDMVRLLDDDSQTHRKEEPVILTALGKSPCHLPSLSLKFFQRSAFFFFFFSF